MPLIEVERAYLAGIIDGEGCVSVYHRTKYLTPTVQISNTRIELLEWLKARFGGGIYLNKEGRPNHKPHWLWFVAGQKALSVIQEARPYLLLKNQQADLLLALKRYKTYPRDKAGRIRRTMTTADFEENSELVRKIRLLNRRGVLDATHI